MRLSISLCALLATSAFAAEPSFGDINITYKRSTNDLDVMTNQISASDTSMLFNNVPGFSTYTGGGISNMPVIRGLNDDRIKVEIEGMPLTSSCPNHMNTPTSYIDPKKVKVIELMAGITPVSMGGDSIAGTISVDSGMLEFTNGGYKAGGEFGQFNRSSNFASDTYMDIYGASKNFHLGYRGSYETAGDYKDGTNNTVLDTLFAQRNNSGYFGWRDGAHYIKLEVGNQIVPYEGYANQYMDLLGDNATYTNAAYQGLVGNTAIDAKGFWKMATHYMNFIPGQKKSYAQINANPAGMPMNTQSLEFGGKLKFITEATDNHHIGYGADLHHYYLNDWWPPSVNATGMNMAGMNPYTFQNINNAHRNKFGFFAESNYDWSEKLKTNIGIRYDNIAMNTGAVQGYNNGSATPAQNRITTAQYTMAANDPVDAAWFNAQNRAKNFNLYDLTAIAKYEAAAFSDVELGYGRKNRAPNIYELYSWAGQAPNSTFNNPTLMDMRMIGWFGDGNGYTGNLSLKPETANIVSATAAFHDEAQKIWLLKVTPYYNYVQNYIDVNVLTSSTASTTVPVNYLQFANHDAVIGGVDAAAKYSALRSMSYGDIDLKATLSYTRGYRTDGNNLYHIMPFNGTFGVEHRYGSLTSGLDVQGVGTKDAVEQLRREQTTPGYGLVNFKASYEWKKTLVFDFAITNLFNQFYWQPLGGVNIAQHNVLNPTGNTYAQIAGEGRSYNTGVRYKF